MRKLLILLSFPFFTRAQPVPEVNLQGLMELVQTDTLHVVNFWATWCGPCVKELPYFEQLHAAMQDRPVRVTLASLDSPSKMEEKLMPFLTERGIKSRVVLFSETNPNRWIPSIDSTWTGSIPATALYRHGQKVAFAEQEFMYESLRAFVEEHLP